MHTTTDAVERNHRRRSARVDDLRPSPIRDILHAIDRPGMISFAGGLPSADTFPVFDGPVPSSVLQYGPTEGDPELRERIAADLDALGIDTVPDRILVLSGSQQGIDLVSKLFVDPGTVVAVESPTYLAALQSFRLFGARFDRFSPDQVTAELWRRSHTSFAYCVPTFQNPTGHCATATERASLAAACDGAGVTLFEDDPYRDLVYESCERRPVCAQVNDASWIYQGSFSKTLAPGLRLGYLTASADLFDQLVQLKQAADLHSNRLSQWLVLRELESDRHQVRMAELRDRYRVRRDDFASALDRHFADVARWEVPRGGLFFWLRLGSVVDTRPLLAEALARGVAFMPGEPFHPEDPDATGTLRLNFSHTDPALVDRGLSVLAELLRDAMDGAASR
jgi:DNA-binding transcriptional MocR family regulator